VLRGHGLELRLGWGRFAAILNGADLVLSMAGTAAEQAVGLAKPVLQLAGRGPQFTENFAEAQRRLLGPGLFCAPGPAGTQGTLKAGAALAAQLLEELKDPQRAPALAQRLRLEAERRIGAPGGTQRMADAIMGLLPLQSHG
jgi:uncharacterized protein (TIGR03492 family)